MTKILFFGDSYTGGDELWEEKNIPGYSTMTRENAAKVSYPGTYEAAIRKDLTYTGFIRKMRPDWEILNAATGGSGQSLIVANAYSNYSRIKAIYPDEKIICVVQDTFRNRFTYLHKRGNHYFGLNVDHTQNHLMRYPEEKDLVKFANTFLNDENLGTQFYAQSFGIMEFFRSANVPAVNFSFYNHELIYADDEPGKNIDLLKQEYVRQMKIFPKGAVQRILDYYDVTPEIASLPGHHIKHQYHEIVANDLVAYIETNLLK